MIDVDTFLTTLYMMGSMTFARSLCPLNHTRAPRLPSAGVRWLPWLCSRSGRALAASAAFTAMRNATCGMPSRRCPRGSHTIGRSAGSTPPWSHFFCLSSSSWRPCCARTKLSTAPAPARGMPSAVARAGCPAWRILAGATGWVGMKASICCWRSTPVGMITGFGFGPASTKDHRLAETFFALRRHPHPGLASVGAPASGPYVVDKGFEGQANQETGWRAYGAQVICPPKRLRRWLGCARSWRRYMRSSGIRSVSIVNGPMTSVGVRHAWRRRWPCIISACG